jgi:integrase/recombinase XerD
MLKRLTETCGADAETSGRMGIVLKDYKIGSTDKKKFIPLKERITHFLAAKRIECASKNTLENYQIYLLDFAKRVPENPSMVDTDDIRIYLSYLSNNRHLKLSSSVTVLRVLRSFFTWLVTEEIISSNPTAKIKSPRISAGNSRFPLSVEDLERLRNICQTYREKSLMEFLYSTGCRVSEVSGINLNDINFLERSVGVLGKGGKRRTVYFSVKASLMIQEYVKNRKGGTSLFSSSKAPHEALKVSAIQKIVKRLGEKAGLSRRLHPHIFRHTLASVGLNNGMDLVAIQHLLGHASVSTTQIYAKMSNNNIRREHERFVA